MIKLIFLINRKAGTTPGEFIDYYEKHHADLALKYIRPFLLDYRRNYPQNATTYVSAVSAGDETGASPFTYDSITEMWFKDRAAVDGMFAVLSEPEVRRIVGEDEDRFIDAKSVVMLECMEGRSAL